MQDQDFSSIPHPAYVITNENLRWQIASQSDNPQKNILTVAASGDQALFYAINGATHIDTFDITPFAGLIQEIKTVAIQVLNRKEYIELLNNLRFSESRINTVHMNKILPHLSQHNRQLILEYEGYGFVFSAGGGAQSYPEHLPTNAEYAQMRQMITKPFNFINVPLHKLHTHLNMRYDIINISNIFDKTYDIATQDKIVRQLYPYLNIGGRILYPEQSGTRIFEGQKWKLKSTDETVMECTKIPTPGQCRNNLFVFQRTR